MLTWRQTHTQFPGKGGTEHDVRGYPFFPVFIAKTTALFLWVLGGHRAARGVLPDQPDLAVRPLRPRQRSAAGSQPDWYMGWLEGALRIMPAWEINAWGHTVPMSVLVPALVVPGLLFTGLAVYPFLERWVTGDHEIHHLLDRPRDVPARTGVGVAGMIFYGTLWLAGANDILAERFHVSLFATTWFFRVPDRPRAGDRLRGRLPRSASASSAATSASSGTGWRPASSAGRRKGGFSEVERPLPDERIAAITDPRPAPAFVLDVPPPIDGVESPRARRPATRVRAALNRRFREDLAVVPARPAGGPAVDGEGGDGLGGNGAAGNGQGAGEIGDGSPRSGASAESAGEQKADDRPGGGHGVVAEVAGQGAAEPEVGEAVDDRPGGDRGGPVGAPPAGPLAVAVASPSAETPRTPLVSTRLARSRAAATSGSSSRYSPGLKITSKYGRWSTAKRT